MRSRKSLLVTLFVCASALTAQTRVIITNTALQTNARAFGINLGGQNFYDSGQLLRNLVSRNPGFEGEEWQTILHCASVSANTCTDVDQYSTWPANFITGADYEVLSGHAKGAHGKVTQQLAAAGGQGIHVMLQPAPAGLSAKDFVLLRTQRSGHADTGWWTKSDGGATFSTELHDLSPHSPGKQALRVTAMHAGQQAELTSWFDTLEGHSFLRMRGPHTLSFRARPLQGARAVHVTLQRSIPGHGTLTFFDKTIGLRDGWQDYTFPLTLDEPNTILGPVSLTFRVQAAEILFDDAELTQAADADNLTAFRNQVVTTLRALHPSILRWMDSGNSFGSSIDNLLSPDLARRRTGYSLQRTTQEDVSIGIPDFLALCQAIHAEPWIALPLGTTPQQMQALLHFLAPWQQHFTRIHLELGNEAWNRGSFSGAVLDDAAIYGQRAHDVFQAARRSPSFNAAKYDLVAGSFSAVPWWTGEELKQLYGTANTIAVAPYLFTDFRNASSAADIFGPMLAQPEQWDSRSSGQMAQQHAATNTSLAIYEVNLSTAIGSPSITQQQIDSTVPSLGGALAVITHMLLMQRDLGVMDQCVFALSEYRNSFHSSDGGSEKTTPLWGITVDMGGPDNARRPLYEALRAVNTAIHPNLLATRIEGINPTWNQPSNGNDNISLQGAHELQTFAYAEGNQRTLIAINLSLQQAHTITISGAHATGPVTIQTLNAPQISANNEHGTQVHLTTQQGPLPSNGGYSLPAHSLTIFAWHQP